MLTGQVIIAGSLLCLIAARPRSWGSAAAAASAAVLLLGLSGLGPVLAAARSTAPLFAFLTAALLAAVLAERAGLAERAAVALARLARGRTLALFGLVCLLCALLTALLSLDGAVVLMVPVLAVLHRRFGAPFRPLFGATLAVANAFSIALPEGNPTNLVVMERLGLSAGAFVSRMAAPAIAATVVCVGAVALGERRALAGRFAAAGGAGSAQRSGAALLLAPVRISLQVGGLLAVLLAVRESLGVSRVALGGATLPALVAVALAVGAVSAVTNNLPASVIVAALLAPGSAAYAALAGLAAGALATPHGSVATLIAVELGGAEAERSFGEHTRTWLAAAAAAIVAAAAVLWAGA